MQSVLSHRDIYIVRPRIIENGVLKTKPDQKKKKIVPSTKLIFALFAEIV